MTIIIEIDRNWAGIGIDWGKKVKGIRLGFVAVHLVQAEYQKAIMITKSIYEEYAKLKEGAGND